MGMLTEVLDRDVKRKGGNRQVLAESVAEQEAVDGVALAPDGKVLIAATDRQVVVVPDKGSPVSYPLTELHSVSVIGGAEHVLFAPLQRDRVFESVVLTADDAHRLATFVRARLMELHEPGAEWWDDPAGTLGLSLWPAGLLVRPASSAVPELQWFTVSFVNTGIQVRTTRHPQDSSRYKGDAREFISWSQVRSLAVEGTDQIERRPSVGAVMLFGVLGLGASKSIRRSYLVVDTHGGSYIFERHEMLPVALAGFLAPVLRHFAPSPAEATGITAEQFAAHLGGQARTNELLGEILAELRRRAT
jgi:hypothetical protein